MLSGDDERVPGGNRETVQKGNGRIRLQPYPFNCQITEWAGCRRHVDRLSLIPNLTRINSASVRCWNSLPLFTKIARMKIHFGLFLAACSLLLPNYAEAWSGPGHLAIAAEAYRELSPELKAEAFEVLKAHPDFAKWEKAYHPNPNLDLPMYVFMRSSTWPDEIRRSGSKYDHPNWHFIDYPLRPPAFPLEPGPKPTDDVLFGVAQCEKTLSDTNANPELRAVSLSYLIHLVGDMHQPLHCVSLFTAAYPNGDRGGNDFYVKPAPFRRGFALA